MGLDDKARLTGVLETLIELYNSIDPYKLTTWHGYKYNVKKIMGNIETMVGLVIQQMETNKGYWITGNSQGCLRNAIMRDLDLAVEPPYAYNKNELSFGLFASHMGFSEQGRQLAYWWEMYKFIPALSYYVNRYSDKLFTQEFRKHFNKLNFNILNLKEVICCSKQEEQVLLWKYSFFSEHYHIFGWDQDTPWMDKVKVLRELTQEELCDKIEELREYENKLRDNYYNKQPSKVDPVYGKVKDQSEDKGNNA